MSATSPTLERVVGPTVCLGCGCACDDILLTIRDEQIREAQHACALGRAWYGDGRVPARAYVGNGESSVEAAVDATAALLGGAARPLVYLAPGLSCEAQRAAVALADVLHATLDSVTTDTVLPSIIAAQERGTASATLGELRNRADVLVWWAVDPAERYPRFASRYAPEPRGLAIPDGRRSRTVIAVDVGDARAPLDADHRVHVESVDEVATLVALRALVAIGPEGTLPHRDDASWTIARTLAPWLCAARYLAIVHDAEPGPAGAMPDEGRTAALSALAQAAQEHTRAALCTLRAGGNRSGADAVCTAATGYPVAIDFARGHPRYLPYESAATRLGAGSVDALLVVGNAAEIPAAVLTVLGRVPVAVIGPRASECAPHGAVARVDTAVAGIHEGGTALRLDDVPLPLGVALAGPPPARDVVRALTTRVVATARTGTRADRVSASGARR